MGELFQPMHLLLILVWLFTASPIIVVPYWQIFKKAGFAGPLSVLMLVPLVGLVVLYIVAFSRWKVAPEGAVSYPMAPPSPAPLVS